MNIPINHYAMLFIVFSLSLIAAFFLPIGEVFKGIAATPAIAALVASLYQILRDHSEFERANKLKDKEHFFNLGITSHMANTAFDKHVEFCEKYMIEVHAAIVTLFGHGPTEKASKHAGNLYQLKRDYSAWIPKSISLQLEPFEDAISRIGNLAGLAESLRDDPSENEARIRARKEARDILSVVTGIEVISETNPDHTAETVKDRIRSILGIDELTTMRSLLIKKATQALNET